ncbi:MAG: PEP-CTERM sorting domain-containing protein [Terriglobales bacterium]
MKRFGLALSGAVAALGVALAVQPASAAPLVNPNGSTTVTIDGPNSVAGGTNGIINAGTTSLTLSGPEAVGSFTPIGSPAFNNLCTISGCTSPPGFLHAGDVVTQSLLTFPVNVSETLSSPDLVTITDTTGPNCSTATPCTVDFNYTSINTAVLSPTGPAGGSSGSLTLDLLGTFHSNTGDVVYSLGQSADLVIACGQTAGGGGISCSKTLDTPAVIATPEPASLALLGAALFGFGAFYRNRRKGA